MAFHCSVTFRFRSWSLLMLRCEELGPNIAGLGLLIMGFVDDMIHENSRDSMERREEALQGDMDRF